jgi:hypothetical protein
VNRKVVDKEQECSELQKENSIMCSTVDSMERKLKSSQVLMNYYKEESLCKYIYHLAHYR